MRSRAAFLAAGMVLVNAVSTLAADEKSFEVRLERPFAAGQVYSVSTTGTTRSTQKIETPDGQVNIASNFRRSAFDGDVHVEKVDDAARPSALSITVKRLTIQSSAVGRDQSDAAAIVPAGTVIVVTFDQQTPTFAARDKKAIPDDAMAVLRREFHRSPLRDDIFGTPEKKKAGDTWAVNTAAMKVDLTDPQGLDPRGFSGEVSLKSLRKVLGIDCIQLEAVLKSKKIPSLAVEPVEAGITVTYMISLPVDTSKPVVAYSMRTLTHAVIEQKPLGKGVVRTTSDSELLHEATWSAK